MTFEEALAALGALSPRGWRLGLNRMNEFVRLAGLTDTLTRFKTIHVGGTNGKGSVTATVQSLLIEQGHRTGAFFSPFVYDPRERVQVGRDYISEADFARLTEWLIGVGEQLSETEFGGITEFELKTAIGLAEWREKECDWIALEVGLGGRFDATNVVSSTVSVIVSIGLDHVAILGDTLEKIAFEKAGIIEEGRPLILGQMASGPRGVILDVAHSRRAPVWEFGREILVTNERGTFTVTTPMSRYEGLVPSLHGVHQPHNMALAIAACDAANAIIEPSKVRSGVSKTRIPGRFEERWIRGRRVILDGAHNAESAEALAQTLASYLEGQIFVMLSGMVAGHDALSFYRPFADQIKELHLVPLQFHRGRNPMEIGAEIEQLHIEIVHHDFMSEAINDALDATPEGGSLVVTGSFYLVGEVGNRLKSYA